MNTRSLRLALALAGLTVALNVSAHDPKEHEKEAAAAQAKPDCTKLKTMDMSKMDPNDPVMKAMMAKCAKTDPAAAAAHEHGDGHAPTKDAAKDGKKDAAKDDKKDDQKVPTSADEHGGH